MNIELLREAHDSVFRDLGISEIPKTKFVSHRINAYYQGWPRIACVFDDKPKIHVFDIFKRLSEDTQREVIRHETCHIVDVMTNGLQTVIRRPHSGYFLEIMQKIGCTLMSVSVQDDWKFQESGHTKNFRKFAETFRLSHTRKGQRAPNPL